MGVKEYSLCDKFIISGRSTNDFMQENLAKVTTLKVNRAVADAMKGANIFIGVSAPNVVTKEMVASMTPIPCFYYGKSDPNPSDLAKEAELKLEPADPTSPIR